MNTLPDHVFQFMATYLEREDIRLLSATSRRNRDLIHECEYEIVSYQSFTDLGLTTKVWTKVELDKTLAEMENNKKIIEIDVYSPAKLFWRVAERLILPNTRSYS